MDKDKLEAVQNVVDRVSSYQESAPDGTVEKELRKGLADVDLELSDDEIRALVGAIESSSGEVDVADVLG